MSGSGLYWWSHTRFIPRTVSVVCLSVWDASQPASERQAHVTRTTSHNLRLAGDEPLPNRGDSDDTFSDVREDVFETVVEDNPNVCSRCFFRHRCREERPNTASNEKRAQKSTFLEYEVPERPMMDKLDWRYYETQKLEGRVGYDYVPDERGSGRSYEGQGYGNELEEKIVNAIEFPTVDGGKQAYCTNCGIVGTNDNDEAMSLLEAMRAAHTLSHTFREYQIPHDWRCLVSSVRAFKTIRPLSAHDIRIFRKATENAVTLAEDDRTPSTTFTPNS